MAGGKTREVKRRQSPTTVFWLSLAVGLSAFRHLSNAYGIPPTAHCSLLIVLSCQLHKERVIGVEAVHIFRSYQLVGCVGSGGGALS